MQLVDELSMIYTTCLMTYASFSYSRSVTTRVILAVSLTGLAVFITLYYHYLQDPVFHQNAYALLTTVVVFRSMYTMEKTLRPKWRNSTEEDRLARQKQGLPVPTKEHQHFENVRDEKTIKTMWFMVIYGLSMFLGGFFIWNLDNVFCTEIRQIRRAVGLPWGIFLEGHGWWYVSNRRPDFLTGTFTKFLQARHDRYRCIPLYHMGHLAPPLPQQQARRLPPALGALLANPRGDPHLWRTIRERSCSGQKVNVRKPFRHSYSFCNSRFIARTHYRIWAAVYRTLANVNHHIT
jgi:hypothetical protein